MEEGLEEKRELLIQKKVWKLRREGKTWIDVADLINKQFDKEFTSGKVKDMYDTYAARASTIVSTTKNMRVEANAVNKEFQNELKELLDNIRETAKKHMDYSEKALSEQYNEGDYKSYFKNAPVLIRFFSNVLDQVNLLDNRLKKIQETQEKFSLTELDILRILNKGRKKAEKDTGMVQHPGTGELIMIDKKNKKKKVFDIVN